MTDTKLIQASDENIRPLLPTFQKIHATALTKMGFILTTIKEPLTNRTKATLFHNLLMNGAKEHFPAANVKIVEHYESISLIINGLFSGRFKKLNNKGMPSNIPTKRNIAIVCQQLQLWDLPNITHVDIGYQINSTWTDFITLQVVCRNNKTVSFTMPFNFEVIEVEELTIKETPQEIEVPQRVTTKSVSKKTKEGKK